jgi:uncharacterized protein YcfJ
MRIFALLVAGIMAVSLCGCTGTEKGAAIGGGSGAIIGGVVGNQLGHNTAAGIAIGAVGGALLGGLIGSEGEKSAQKQQAPRTIATCPKGHQVDVSGFPAGSDVRCPVCNTIFKI